MNYGIIRRNGRQEVLFALTVCLFFLIFLMHSPVSAYAADGDSLWDTTGDEGDPWIVSDGNGGVIAASGAHLQCGSSPNRLAIRHIDHSGTVTVWDTSTIGSSGHSSQVLGVAPDGSGGVLVAWIDTYTDYTFPYCKESGAFVTRFDASGTQVWGNISVPRPTTSTPVGMCADNIGGLYLSVDATLYHYNSEGVLSEQFLITPDAYGVSMTILNDGRESNWPSTSQAGVYVVWRERVDLGGGTVGYPLRAQWFHNGPEWGADGVELVADIGPDGLSSSAQITAERNGNDGLLVSWDKQGKLYAQSLGNDGVKQWGVWGILVRDKAVVGGNWPVATSYENTITPDGNGGAILSWIDWRHSGTDYADSDIYAIRVESNGTLGSEILVPPYVINGQAPGTQRGGLVAASDGTGGALIAFQDYYYQTDSVPLSGVSLTRISPEGVKIFAQYYGPYAENYFQSPTGIIFDQSGPDPDGAIIAWGQSGIYPDDKYGIAKIDIDTSPPANDDCSEALEIGLGSHTGSLIRATNDGEQNCSSTEQPDVWYRFTAPSTGELRITTCGTNDLGGEDVGMDTVLSVHGETCSTTSNNVLECNDDAPAGICGSSDQGLRRDSAVSLHVRKGDILLVRVSKHASSQSGRFNLAISYLSIDSDGDGVSDENDTCPGFDDSSDSDSDGIPDDCDTCMLVNNSTSPDCDTNGIPDSCDLSVHGRYEDFSSVNTQGFNLNGNAVIAAAVGAAHGEGGCRLTEAANSQIGSVVFAPVSSAPVASFYAAFDFNIGGGTGADGMSFVLLDSTYFDLTALFAEEGPPAGNSLVVKFDTYQNDTEISDNFIALIMNGTVLATFDPPFNLDDHTWRHVAIEVEGGSLSMSITSPDGDQVMVFSGQELTNYTPFVTMYGFGARTGGENNEHWVDNILFRDISHSNDCNSNQVPDTCEAANDDDHDGIQDICDSCIDRDGDGFGAPGSSGCPNGSGTDCTDTAAFIFPGAVEVCDGVDNNCDAVIDDLGTQTCGTGACQVTVSVCVNGQLQTCEPLAGSTEICTDGLDNDCDGTTDCNDTDCSGTGICTGDSDEDGLPDQWELDNGLDPNDDGSINPDNGANGDLDKDGHTNAEEFTAQTSANDGGSYAIDLHQGYNTVSLPSYYLDGTTRIPLTAFELLNRLGGESMVVSIQRFDVDTGVFVTTGYTNGALMGEDFPIIAGEGYTLYMKNAVERFVP